MPSTARRGIHLVCAAATFGATLWIADAEAAGVSLAPHRAVYDMTLERTAASAGISALAGRMVFELKGSACEGYVQNMRFVTETLDQHGKPTLTDQRSTFKEFPDRRRFTFDTRQYRNDRLAETTSGSAVRTGSDGPAGLEIKIEKPGAKTMKVDAPVLFPVEHSMRLLEAAKSGKSLFVVNLYDGSEKGEKVYSTTAAVGPRQKPGMSTGSAADAVAPDLGGLSAWPISLSYFELDGRRRDAVPDYELSFLYFENGVSRKLMIDYGSFSMSGRLVKLEMLPEEPCTR